MLFVKKFVRFFAIILVPELQIKNTHPIQVLGTLAFVYKLPKSESSCLLRPFRFFTHLWSGQYPNVNRIEWTCLVQVVTGLVINMLQASWPTVGRWLVEVRFVSTYEQLFMNYLMTSLFSYVMYTTFHLNRRHVSPHYNYIDRLFRQVVFEDTPLTGLSQSDSSRMRRIFSQLYKFYAIPNYIIFRPSCHMVIGYSMVRSVGGNFGWVHTCISLPLSFCYYYSFVWFCLYYVMAVHLFGFFCFYFHFRLATLHKQLTFKCYMSARRSRRLLTFPSVDSSNRDLLKRGLALQQILVSFSICLREFLAMDEVLRVLNGGVFMLAFGFNLFFYYFVFFAFDRVPNAFVYTAFVTIALSNGLSHMVVVNSLGELVRQQASLIIAN
jgi:hypothetical protein